MLMLLRAEYYTSRNRCWFSVCHVEKIGNGMAFHVYGTASFCTRIREVDCTANCLAEGWSMDIYAVWATIPVMLLNSSWPKANQYSGNQQFQACENWPTTSATRVSYQIRLADTNGRECQQSETSARDTAC
jgi:hypothetical protein